MLKLKKPVKAQNKNRVRPAGRTLPKATDDSDMYNREFPSGNFLFFVVCMMSLFRLPRGKLPLAFLAVPAGKDGRVECPCQTVDDFIGVRGSVCGLFLFVQTHTPLTIRRQFSMIVPDASFLYESRKFICYGIMGGTVTNNENQLFS